ncbi:MAG: YdcF family protein [Mycobacterium leprae]
MTRRKRSIWLSLALVALLVIVWAGHTLLLIQSTWRQGRETLAAGPAVVADAAIVLGCSAWGDQPSPALAERLDVAAELYRTGRVRHLVLTGGVDTGNTISEAEVGARYLERVHAIPAEALSLETESRSTTANLHNSRAILAANGWSSVALVTHGYHLHRALLMARAEGLDPVGVAVESKVLFLPYHVTRELAALAWFELQ